MEYYEAPKEEIRKEEFLYSGGSDYDIFESEDVKIYLHDTVRIKQRREIWQVKIPRITFSDLPDDENYLKIKWLDTKKKIFKKRRVI